MAPTQTLALELSKTLLPAILIAILGYWLTIRGKNNDINIQRVKELNIVLSNMLTVWYYFARLRQLTTLSQKDTSSMILPVAVLPQVLHQSGMLDNESFTELEKSIHSLKQYDPIAFHQLEGIGRRLAYFKENFVAPALKSTSSHQQGQTPLLFQQLMLGKITSEFEELLMQVARRISKSLQKQVRVELQKKAPESDEALIEEYNRESYELITAMIPKEADKPDYEAFKAEMRKPEVQAIFIRFLPLLTQQGFGSFFALLSQDSAISIEDIEQGLLAKQA